MRLGRIPLGLAVAALGVWVFLIGYRIPSLAHLRFGPGFVPGLIGIGLVLTGLFLLLEQRLAGERERWIHFDPALSNWRAQTGIALLCGGIVFYILASETIGFIPTAAFVVWLNLVWYWTRPVAAAVIALAATISIQLLFGRLMQVPLPAGLLEPLRGALSWML